MAGDWMKIELDLPDKPEVHYMAGILSIDPAAVVGNLIKVWSWFDKHTEDGNAYGVTYSLLDRITGVAGFGESMCLAGWMEQRDKVLCMPNFDYHTSESAKKRALTAKRVAKLRNADGVTETLPEKRREEKSIKPENPMGGKPPYPPEFEAAWQQYPKRSGNNPKADAFKCWGARVKEGVTPATMLAGLQRYAAWCAATDKIGTETVMQASRFFGKSKPYEQDFALPADRKPVTQWWASDAGIQAKGAELGLTPRAGESWQQFRGRINEKLGGSDVVSN